MLWLLLLLLLSFCFFRYYRFCIFSFLFPALHQPLSVSFYPISSPSLSSNSEVHYHHYHPDPIKRCPKQYSRYQASLRFYTVHTSKIKLMIYIPLFLTPLIFWLLPLLFIPLLTLLLLIFFSVYSASSASPTSPICPFLFILPFSTNATNIKPIYL